MRVRTDDLPLRLIACFDVVGDRVTKALRFEDNQDVEDAVLLARHLSDENIDEIIFFDINASPERRTVDASFVSEVGRQINVPFTVGGGISSLEDMYRVLEAGAEKISVDSMAVRHPVLLDDAAAQFGVQCVVLSVQAKRRQDRPHLPSGCEVMIDGGRIPTGKDVVEWVREAVERGAGEVCLNSIDQDGTGAGYDLDVSALVADAVDVPVIASGGAGKVEHLAAAYTVGASAAIISSLLYSPRMIDRFTVPELKASLEKARVPIRPIPQPFT